MEFRDVVRRRRMVRRYDETAPVDPAAIDRMLAHATRAPSAGFSQGWAFLVLDAPDEVGRFWAATTPTPQTPDQPPDQTRAESSRWLTGMRTAPVIIVPLSHQAAYLDRYAQSDKGWTDRDPARWPVPYWHVDTGMAALLILQTAVDEGLGACFFGIPGERTAAFREEFGVPETHTPIGAITIGHPHPKERGASGSPARRGRLPVDEVSHRGRW